MKQFRYFLLTIGFLCIFSGYSFSQTPRKSRPIINKNAGNYSSTYRHARKIDNRNKKNLHRKPEIFNNSSLGSSERRQNKTQNAPKTLMVF